MSYTDQHKHCSIPRGNMHYSDEAFEEIEMQYSELRFRHNKLFLKAVFFAGRMGNERAKEYILHGVSRRLDLLQRCIDKMFMLFPANRMEKLTQSDQQDMVINLHAFLINIYGIIENIGLALAYENDLIGNKSAQKLHIKEVNLFNKRFQNLLNPKLKEYLTEDTIGKWYRDYAKNYRDALAHRIPPYVLPTALNDEEQRRFKDLDKELQSLTYEKDLARIEAIREEQASLGSSNPLFVHSFFEKAKLVYLHPQLIADYRTVEEILMKALDNFNWEEDTGLERLV